MASISDGISSNTSSSSRDPRPSIAIKRFHRNNHGLLSFEKSDLATHIAYHGDHLKELKCAARSTNKLIRSHYSDFIHEVGRNIYPLIIFSDSEVDGPNGVGSTLTLYRADGSITKVSPALNSNYELYKTCGHLFMGLGVEIGPYLCNASVCHGDITTDADHDLEPANVAKFTEDVSWRQSLIEYLRSVCIFRQALVNAVEADAVTEDIDKLSLASQGEDGEESMPNSSLDLPPFEMQKTMLAMLTSVIEFCETCLCKGFIDVQRWKRLNNENFPHIKKCMKAAANAQAGACVCQITQWKDMMGAKEWRDLYVIIPTVWVVDGENPRKTMFRQLLDEDRVDSHIITTEFPRDHGEARTLLGRIVGDRSIGRFVFGDETKEQRIKTMSLSSTVDVVQDDALPLIWDALESHGCPVRKNRSSNV